MDTLFKNFKNRFDSKFQEKKKRFFLTQTLFSFKKGGFQIPISTSSGWRLFEEERLISTVYNFAKVGWC